MCAIIGVVGDVLPSREMFERARDLMVHRGPDAAGLYYEPKEGVALGHRRLSIIDLSPEGRQPLFSFDDRYAIVFNGEIYNYRELKNEIGSKYKFKTQTDTEVLLAAYVVWGEKCLQKLDGMFAFAIWDRKERVLFVARDRLGIKPLFWSFYNDVFYFSSEMKGILESARMSKVLNKRAFLDYLSYRYPLGESTFFEGVYSFLPGHYAFVTEGKAPKPQKYWELPVVKDKSDAGEEEILKHTEEILKKAVKSHMISDVPLGAYLSGGLDSSALVGFMSEISDKPVKTFSVGFSEEGFNELGHARMVAKKLKTDHHEIVMGENEYFDMLPEAIRYKDAPLHVPNEIPLLALSKELKKHITVVLSGEGADELFGGYGRIFRSGDDFDLMAGRRKLEALSPEEQKTLFSNLKQKYGDAIFEELVDHLLFQYPYTAYETTRSLLSGEVFPEAKDQILNREYIKSELKKAEGLSSSEQYVHFFQRIHLLGILGRLDNAAMGASVEGRVPFIDHKVVEYVSSLPMKYKMAWKSERDRENARVLNSDQISDVHDVTKYLLRKIGSRFLPKEIAERKKLGFPVPLNEWLSGSLIKTGRELLLASDSHSASLYDKEMLSQRLSPGRNALTGRDVWALINLEVWMREYGVRL
ncbi:MAG: asparagine synthase (glutamine-hydrolyzing) [Parcubacteria group bacterium]|nr:asparagine synthase (glutamine-hydrolyzing) [Parcubacteria group bacterium]